MPPKQKTWNYDTQSTIRDRRWGSRPYKRRAAKKRRKVIYREDYATERWGTAATPSTHMGDIEWQMEVAKQPYAQNNPYVLMGLDTGTQPVRAFNIPRQDMRDMTKPKDATVGEYDPDDDAVIMHENVLNTLTPTEDMYVLIHELMHRGFAKWADIFIDNPKAFDEMYDKFPVKTEQDRYMRSVLFGEDHSYIFPKGRYSGFPESFRSAQKRSQLEVEDPKTQTPKHRGIERQIHSQVLGNPIKEGKITKWVGPGINYYSRPVPQTYLDAVDKYVIPHVIKRYPSLANHPAFIKMQKQKNRKPRNQSSHRSWNY